MCKRAVGRGGSVVTLRRNLGKINMILFIQRTKNHFLHQKDQFQIATKIMLLYKISGKARKLVEVGLVGLVATARFKKSYMWKYQFPQEVQ